MKLPAVAPVAAFASGIVLGLQPRVASHAGSRIWLVSVFALICVVLLAGLLLTLGMRSWPSAFLSLFGWAGLRLFGAMLSQKPPPKEHILNRLTAGQIDLKSPLRYRGRMRSEPAQLPWGYALDIELFGVESADGLIPRGRFAESGDHFRRGGKPLWASQSGTLGPARRERFWHSANGSRGGGADPHGRS
jgi:hypothetical protein